MIGLQEYEYFANQALNSMVAIVEELGDEKANESLELPGSNSCFQTLNHCLGVIDYWVGHVVLGRENTRDRRAEFESEGTVSELVRLVASTRQQLQKDLNEIVNVTDIVNHPSIKFSGFEHQLSPGFALLRVSGELTQHLGQMEIIRDVLINAQARPV